MQIYYEFFISATISSPNMTRDSNELRKAGGGVGVMGFKGIAVQGCDPKLNISRFQISRG